MTPAAEDDASFASVTPLSDLAAEVITGACGAEGRGKKLRLATGATFDGRMASGGVQLILRFSYLKMALRFTLVVGVTSEAPDAPMVMHLAEWQHGHLGLQDEADATPLRETVRKLCEQQQLGFGRLSNVAEALDGFLRPKLR